MGQIKEFFDNLVESVTGAFTFDVDPALTPRENTEKVISQTARSRPSTSSCSRRCT
jgi:hypothetical protein